VVLLSYHDNWGNWAWVAGRVAFFVVLLATTAICEDGAAAAAIIGGLTFGAGVLGLLTVLQASQLVALPFSPELLPARQFGPFRMPFPSALGVDTTPDKLGIRYAMALSALMISRAGRDPIVRSWRWRVALSVFVMVGALIMQERGVYLEVGLAMALGLGSLLWADRRISFLEDLRGSLLLALGYGALLLAANAAFATALPQWLVDVGSAVSVQNVSTRLEASALGWKLLQQSPLLGIGHGEFIDYFRLRTSIHNHFLGYLVATGLVGGVPFFLFHLGILASAFRLFARSRGAGREVAAVLCTGVLVTYLAYQFAPLAFVAVFAVVCGLVVALKPPTPLDNAS
jgi:O-antigen ligase